MSTQLLDCCPLLFSFTKQRRELKNIICLYLKFLDRLDNKELLLISGYGVGFSETLIQWSNKASQAHSPLCIFVARSNVLTTISLLPTMISISLDSFLCQ